MFSEFYAGSFFLVNRAKSNQLGPNTTQPPFQYSGWAAGPAMSSFFCIRDLIHFASHQQCIQIIGITQNLSNLSEMIDKWIEQLKGGSCISEADLKKLCTQVMSSVKLFDDDICTSYNLLLLRLNHHPLLFSQVKNLLMEEANVQPVRSPVTVRLRFLEYFVFRSSAPSTQLLLIIICTSYLM